MFKAIYILRYKIIVLHYYYWSRNIEEGNPSPVQAAMPDVVASLTYNELDTFSWALLYVLSMKCSPYSLHFIYVLMC